MSFQFETRYHAYSGIVLYVVIFFFINLGMAGWSFHVVDKKAAAPGSDCSKINVAVHFLGSISLLEAVVNALLVYGFLHLMQTYFAALFALVNLCLYGLLLLLKTIGVILGVVWLWGLEMQHCKSSVGTLYPRADLYLRCAIGIIAFQYCVGTFMLLCCGLHHAVDEAVSYVFPTWKDREDWIDGQQVSTFA